MKIFLPRLSPIKELSELPFSEYPDHIKQKIRDKAVERAEKNFIMYGKTLDEINVSHYEHCVKEEEKKIWSSIRGKSLGAVLLLFGVSI